MREDASTGSVTRQDQTDGRFAGRTVQYVRSTLSRPAARRVGDESNRRCVPQSIAQIPVARELLHNRLVSTVAGGRTRGSTVFLFTIRSVEFNAYAGFILVTIMIFHSNNS
jgi:hypothetical protein